MNSIRFESPDVLWFLWLVLVPLILHFISVKLHKKVYFSNVALLKEIKKETASVRRLKDWIQLVIRMLLIAFIVVLFARPFYSQKQDVDDQVNALFMDNSMSMSRSNGSVSLLEESKRKAIAYLQTLDFSSKLYLACSSGEWTLNKMFYRDEAVQKVASLKLSQTSKGFGIYKKKIEELKQVPGFNYLVFSDLQSTSFDLEEVLSDTLNSYQFYPEVGESKCNVYIDSLWIEATSDTEVQQIAYRLKSECAGGSLSVGVKEAKRVLAVSNIDLSENSTGLINLNLEKNKAHLLTLYISDEVATYDNELSFVIDLRERKSVLNFLGKGTDKDLLGLNNLVGEHLVQNKKEHELEIQELKQSSLLVWNLSDLGQSNASMLNEYVEGGGVVVFHPKEIKDFDNLSFLGELVTYEKGESGEVEAFNEHPFFSGAFESQKNNQKWIKNVVSEYAYLKNHNWESLINFENESSLLVRKHKGKGSIFLFTSSIEKIKNFSLYPLSMLKIIESSGGERLPYKQKGKNETVVLNKGERQLIFIKDSSQVKSQSYKVNIDDVVIKTGFMCSVSSDSDTTYYAVNPSEEESVFDFYKGDDLASSHVTFVNSVIDSQTSIGEGKSYLDTYILLIVISLAVMDMTFFALKI